MSMAALSQCHEPGLLIVLTRPKSPDYVDEFHDWYDTEHGPLRMRLDFIRNGYRYKTVCDEDTTVWAGLYDVDRLSGLSEPRYTNLRTFRSARERQLMDHRVDVLQRKLCRLIATRGCSRSHAPIIMNVSFIVKQEDMPKVCRWYDEEYVNDLWHLPGWQRSRCFEVVDGDTPPPGYVELLAVHEFASDEVDEVDGRRGGGSERWPAEVEAHLHRQLQRRAGTDNMVNFIHGHRTSTFHFHHAFRAEDYKAPLWSPSPSPSTLPLLPGLPLLAHAGSTATGHSGVPTPPLSSRLITLRGGLEQLEGVPTSPVVPVS